MLILRNISYRHPNKDLLFDKINLAVNTHDKLALVGNNGSGKSTLLKIIAGDLPVADGEVVVETKPYYVPQLFGQYNHLRVAQVLGIEEKLTALKEILNGNITGEAYDLLGDDWTIEHRCREALKYWQLEDIDLDQKLESLSGGQKTKVFLSGVLIHQPEFLLLDEPSNHLDRSGREILYRFIQSVPATMIVVSHDRTLLNLLETVCELGKEGIRIYGGNYDFYAEQKRLELQALNQDVHSREKVLRKAKEKERETMERQERLDNRGRRKQEKAGVAKIMMNTLRNTAENSTAKFKAVHGDKIDGISKELQELRSALPGVDKIRLGFNDSGLHKGKVLFRAHGINLRYEKSKLWAEDLDLEISSGERIHIKGDNGSGKTSLVKLILGSMEPGSGKVYRAASQTIYIDQEYSLIQNSLTVYTQAAQFNSPGLQEHEIKIQLARFLFTKDDWDKPCEALSGGEKMRLVLCCLTILNQAPDIIALDEPTNNLDLQNVEMVTRAINEYRGTLIVVSHDESFLKEIHIEREIPL